MFTFIKKSLQWKLVTLFVVCALIPLITTAIMSSYYTRQALEKDAFDKLTAVQTLKKAAIKSFFKERLEDIKVLGKSDTIVSTVSKLKNYEDSIEKNTDETFDVTKDEYKTLCKEVDPFFKFYINTYGYQDLYIIDSDHGHIQYSVSRKMDLGTSLLNGPYRDSGFAKLWKKVVKNEKAAIIDYSKYEPYNNEPSIFSGAPVFNAAGKIIAVVALKINTNTLSFIMNERSGLGETGETYLVGNDLVMRSNSRFLKNGSESNILHTKLDTAASRAAKQGKTEAKIITDYRGKKVLSSYSPLNMRSSLGVDIDWSIISEIDTSEAFAPILQLEQGVILVGAIMILLIGVMAIFAARSISVPIKKLSKNFTLMATGNLTIPPTNSQRTDDIGVLLQSFDEMLRMLKKQTMEIIEGTAQLVSTITEIAASTTEFAANSAETATSVAEISTTVEEVRQTSSVSNEKAEDIAHASDKVTEVAENGEKATNEVILSMTRIKNEVESVADSIIKLSSQTQNIGEIIGAVNDIADQSNLLSVNASIEAAKAGEYGKGFAVVAQEVKTLANQSKEATKQISGILNDIQKATSLAVMATERGGKAVEEGVNLSKESGNTITVLADTAVESSRSSKQIAASIRQQAIGLEQLVIAMTSIKEATSQNVSGAKQLEDASHVIQDLSVKLKEITDRYKV